MGKISTLEIQFGSADILSSRNDGLESSFSSQHGGFKQKRLKRNVYTTEKIKPKSEKIFAVVDCINDAIQAKVKISFKIREYDGNKKKVLRNGGEVYVISPYAMYWSDDFYYVVGWSDKRDAMAAYRIDRMEQPEILDEKAVRKPKGFRLTDYSHKVFEMFAGEGVRVKLECRNDLMKYVMDRFGTKFETEPVTDNKTYCYVDVCLSPTFYGWIFGFKGGIGILEPTEAVKEMKEMLNSFK